MDDRRYRLSKSKIAAYEHCPRRLWLQIHNPEAEQIDDQTKALFARGHQIGALACSLIPDGIMINPEPDFDAAIVTTSKLFADQMSVPLFESAFQREDVVCAVDIMLPDESGGWHVAEVKGAARVKPYMLADLATQLWVIEGASVQVSSASIRHLTRRFDADRPGDAKTLFTDTPVLDWLRPVIAKRGAVVAAARACVRGPEPAIRPGRHCTDPFVCTYQRHCGANTA